MSWELNISIATIELLQHQYQFNITRNTIIKKCVGYQMFAVLILLFYYYKDTSTCLRGGIELPRTKCSKFCLFIIASLEWDDTCTYTCLVRKAHDIKKLTSFSPDNTWSNAIRLVPSFKSVNKSCTWIGGLSYVNKTCKVEQDISPALPSIWKSW